jgi:hypothetical protein
LRDVRKTAEYAENFIKKHELIESACANRARSIPKNATIRKEYVKCKKSNCCREKHTVTKELQIHAKHK